MSTRQEAFERQLRASLFRQRLILTLILLAVLTPLGITAWWLGARSHLRQQQEIGDAPLQIGAGEIVSVNTSKNGNRSVIVRVNKVDRAAPDEACPIVQPGEMVAVEYRVGKSGRNYSGKD